MILVITGTSPHGFERLIKEIDRIAGEMDEEIVVQIGYSSYRPKNIRYYFKFTSDEEIKRLYNNARIIVCHAGVGSIITALKNNKPIIVVPRRKKYNEHFDDHQIELAKELEREGISVVYEVENLRSEIKNVSGGSMIFKSERDNLITELRNYLNQVEQNLRYEK